MPVVLMLGGVEREREVTMGWQVVGRQSEQQLTTFQTRVLELTNMLLETVKRVILVR